MVAQVASVIGSEFDRRTLASLTGDEEVDRRVTDLLRREILVERPGGMLNFHHALMREAAYATMLIRTRRELHRRLAEHLIANDADAVQAIALHYVEAGDLAAAFPHLIVAGESSTRSMALSDAIRQFSTALDNVPATADPDLVVRAHDGLGLAYSLVPDLTQTDATYQRLADYADSAGRPSAKVTALNRLAMTTAMMAGDLGTASRYLDEAMVLARESGDERGLAEYHMNACTIAGLRGDLDGTIVHDEQTIQRGGDLGAAEIRAEGMARLATNAVWLMDFDRADTALRDALEAARDLGDELGVAIVNVMGLSRLRLREGDFRGALEVMRADEETLVRYASFYASLAGIFVASLLFDLGDLEGAVFRTAEISERGMPLYAAASSAALARMYASIGTTEHVGELVDSAVEAVEGPLGLFLASSVWADLGFAAFMSGDFQTAGERFERGLATTSASSYWEKPRLLIGRARVHTAHGEHEEAHRALDEAHTFLMEKELLTFDHLLGHGRGEVLLAEGRSAEASRLLTEVLDLAEARGLRVPFIEVATTASRAANAIGDSELGRSHVAAARAKVIEMTSTIVDPVFKSAVESSWLSRLDEPAVS
jgi:tetratricopeptide (TPR) repeat protein